MGNSCGNTDTGKLAFSETFVEKGVAIATPFSIGLDLLTHLH